MDSKFGYPSFWKNSEIIENIVKNAKDALPVVMEVQYFVGHEMFCRRANSGSGVCSCGTDEIREKLIKATGALQKLVDALNAPETHEIAEAFDRKAGYRTWSKT